MRVRYAVAVLSLLVAIAVPSWWRQSVAGEEKTLANLRGQVAYQVPSEKPLPIPVRAQIALSDNAFAITGDSSLGVVTMPDSSRILLGANTRVQLAYFTPGRVASAKFYLYDGRLRFQVEHPQGARANYVFQTPTSQIAVRGTLGDIGLTNNALQVNVYSLSNPALPVQVTFNNGQVFLLHAGQSLTASFVGGAASVTVSTVGRQALSTFSEFGSPQNLSRVVQMATGTTGAAPGSAALTATGAAAGGAAVAGSAGNGGSSGTQQTPPPTTNTPAPGPTSTSVPVTINGLPTPSPAPHPSLGPLPHPPVPPEPKPPGPPR